MIIMVGKVYLMLFIVLKESKTFTATYTFYIEIYRDSNDLISVQINFNHHSNLLSNAWARKPV